MTDVVIRKATVKRSGANMRIVGLALTGETVKVTTRLVEFPGDGSVIATGLDGRQYSLRIH